MQWDNSVVQRNFGALWSLCTPAAVSKAAWSVDIGVGVPATVSLSTSGPLGTAWSSALRSHSGSVAIHTQSPQRLTEALRCVVSAERFVMSRNGVDTSGLRTVCVDASHAPAAHRTLFALRLCKWLSVGPPRFIGTGTFCVAVRAAVESLPTVARKRVRVEEHDEAWLRRQNLNMFVSLGAAAETSNRPRLLTVSVDGGGDVSLIGKGVVFDTGGANLKPGPSMNHMEADKTGAATVVAAALLRALSDQHTGITAHAGLIFNAIDNSSIVPGDVVVAHSGATVAVTNTDAEGRCVLGDLVSWEARTRKPRSIIDVATLTGGARHMCIPDAAVGRACSLIISNANGTDTASSVIRACEALHERAHEMGKIVTRSDVDALRAASASYAGEFANETGLAPQSFWAAVFVYASADTDIAWVHVDCAASEPPFLVAPLSEIQ